MLCAKWQRRSQAKEGVCRDTSFRQDGRNEGEAIRGARHVAIREPWTIERRTRQPLANVFSTDAVSRRSEVRSKRSDVLAFEDRYSAGARLKVPAIIGRIQFAAEANAPTRMAPQRWKKSDSALENRQIERVAQMRNRKVVAGYPRQQLR